MENGGRGLRGKAFCSQGAIIQRHLFTRGYSQHYHLQNSSAFMESKMNQCWNQI